MSKITEKALGALNSIREKNHAVRILVVGDVILDRFLYGVAERISPEAPVPVVDVQKEVFRLGGAANVVRNLRALGADVVLVGIVGDDEDAGIVRELLREADTVSGGLVTDKTRPTAVKTRVFAQHQQVVRFDREGKGPLNEETQHDLAHMVAKYSQGASAIIVSDYAKGVVNKPVLFEVRKKVLAEGLPVTVDPKPSHAELYRGLGIMTPNAKEIFEMTGIHPSTDEEAEKAGNALMQRLDLKAVLVTRGEKGMSLVGDGQKAVHIPTRAKDVYDVTGAGDTAISVFTLAWAAGADKTAAACLANAASGVVVGKLGTAVVTPEELEIALHEPEGEG